MHHIDVVIHLAALKHVGFSESKPMEAVKTNILAVNNLIDAALTNNVEYVINTSTDKAVNPFSVMGTSKLMGEQLIRAADLVSDSTVFHPRDLAMSWVPVDQLFHFSVNNSKAASR